MKNFNFALLVSGYLFVVFWIFARTRALEELLISAIALSPVAILGFVAQGRGLPRKAGPPAQPWFSHILALAASVVLAVFVYRTGNFAWNAGKTDMALHYFDNYILGWTLDSAMLVLAISVVMAASAASIWSTYRFRETNIPFLKNEGPRVFFADLPETTRILVYAYIFIFAWAAGVGAVHVIWKEPSLQILMVRLARASLPMAALLIIALMRLPFMGLGLIAVCGGVWYLAIVNLDTTQASVFTGAPVVIIIVYFAISAILASKPSGQVKSSVENIETKPSGAEEK